MDDIKLITKYMEPKETYKNDINKRSNYTKFCEIGPVCQWTNEPLKYYLVDDLQNKKVLSVTAGGDHILHTILSGATDITAFDINRFSKYFVDLKMTMVKKYDYSTFWKMANVLSQDGIKNINTLNPVIKTLSDTHQQFFEAIEKRFYDIRNNEKLTYWLGMHLMMEYSYGNIRKYAYGEFDKYLLLQEKINNVNLKYIDYTLEELPSKLKNKYESTVKTVPFFQIYGIICNDLKRSHITRACTGFDGGLEVWEAIRSAWGLRKNSGMKYKRRR